MDVWRVDRSDVEGIAGQGEELPSKVQLFVVITSMDSKVCSEVISSKSCTNDPAVSTVISERLVKSKDVLHVDEGLGRLNLHDELVEAYRTSNLLLLFLETLVYLLKISYGVHLRNTEAIEVAKSSMSHKESLDISIKQLW